MAILSAGLVELAVLMCLLGSFSVSHFRVYGCRGYAARSRHRPGSSSAHPRCTASKSDREAGPVCEDALALVLGDVEGGEVPGAELADDDTVRSLTPPNAPTTKPDARPELCMAISVSAGPVASARACGLLRRASCVELLGGAVAVLVYLCRALLHRRTEFRG